MDDRWERAEALFHRAAELPATERAAFLHDECDDEQLRAEVEELLAAHDGSATRLDDAFGTLTEPLANAVETGERIGPFELDRVIASGGMGTVYEATQDHPRRSVALKLMRRGFESPAAVRRFEYESQILARLQHPGIAHVYESGTLPEAQSQRPWFAMEMIADARTITAYAREERLGVEARLRLIIQACDAVHHGHQKGVVHRDLKPDNVLVSGAGRVKIIDFGVAKASDPEGEASLTMQTAADQVVGTPKYMSPEQASGKNAEIDTRTDVHALGVLTYELVTGRVPYDVEGLGILDALERIREGAPDARPLRESAVAEDLRVIVLKALEKEPERRYDSAKALAEDLERMLAHEPILARPASTVYQLRKFARRNRVLVGSVAAVGLALTAGIVGTTVGLLEARSQRERAEQERVAAEAARDDALWGREFLTQILRSADPWAGSAGVLSLEDVLDLAARRLDEERPESVQTEAEMRTTLGEVYRKVAALERSEQQFRHAVDLTTPEDELGRTARTGLARTLNQRDQVEEAEALAREMVEAWTRAEGEDGAHTLRTRDLWAMIRREQGKLDEAVATLEDVIKRSEAAFGRDHPDTVTSRANLATVLYRAADYDRARELFAEVLELREATLGPEHPDTVTTMSSLAALHAREERYPESAELYERAWEGSKKSLGERHIRTLNTMSNYAAMLRRWGKAERAEPISRAAYEGRVAVLGPDHSDTLQSLTNYGTVLYTLEKYDDAERLYKLGIEAAKRRPDENARDAITLRSNYGALLRDTKRTDEAMVQYREATAEAHRIYAADHWMPWAVQANYADMLFRLGRVDEAQAKLEESYRRLHDLRGPENDYTRGTRVRLVKLYEHIGLPDPEQAVRVARVGG